MSNLCKTIVDGEPYDYAPHPIQIKWTHCQTIDGGIIVRWETATLYARTQRDYIGNNPFLQINCQS